MTKQRKRRKKGGSWMLYMISGVGTVALGLSLLASYVDPTHFVLPAFAGLAFPVIVLFNLILVIFFLLLRPRIAWINAVVLLPAFFHTGLFLQVNDSSSDCKPSTKVMSYNVRLFDLYNWTNNKVTRNKIIALLNKEDPDILCLQEFFYSPDKHYFNTLDTLEEVLGARYAHTYYSSSRKQRHYFGIATFSRYPIVAKGRVDFGEKTHNACIYTDLLMGGDTIRVYNAHLASIKLNDREYRYINGLTGGEEDVIQKPMGTEILSQLNDAFIHRSGQVKRIMADIAVCPYPTILCADLNDTPCSFAYNTISDKLKDAFVEEGNGLGRTYNGKLPVTRIDYIFHTPDWACCHFSTLPEEYSDHFPITANMNWAQSAP